MPHTTITRLPRAVRVAALCGVLSLFGRCAGTSQPVLNDTPQGPQDSGVSDIPAPDAVRLDIADGGVADGSPGDGLAPADADGGDRRDTPGPSDVRSDDAEPGDADAGDVGPDCVCREGPCCDGCEFLPADSVCAVEEEAGCPWTTDCGSTVGVREVQRLCSGGSATCGDGPVLEGPWRELETCSAIASCVPGERECVPSAMCPCPEGMVHVPAGSFPMGSRPGEGYRGDEYPQHDVHLQAYCIDRYEVTAGDYVVFLNDAAPDDSCSDVASCACIDWPFYYPDEMGYPPYPAVWWNDPPSGPWVVGSHCQAGPREYPIGDCSSHPVDYVTWCGARRYCEWAGKRLPSEAEWERAAKGTTDRQFVWGDEAVFEGRANCGEDLCADGSWWVSWEYASPVGSFPLDCSPVGAYDMTGNVDEWVEDDSHWDYVGAPTDGSAWVSRPGYPKSEKIVRGGNFLMEQRARLRVAWREHMGGDRASVGVDGFRCAWSGESAPRQP